MKTIGRPSLTSPRGRVLIYGVVASLIVLSAIFLPELIHQDPLKINLEAKLSPPGFRYQDGSVALLGTDGLGRDVLSRIVSGSRVSLSVSGVSVCIALLFGGALGLIAGYFGGAVDSAIMRVADAQLSFPSILLAAITVSVLGTNVFALVIALGVSRWVMFARIVRGAVLDTKSSDYVTAARALGYTDTRIMLRHILPGVLSPVLVVATLALGQVILAESALSFIGLGIQPPTPSWGGIINEGRQYLHNAWWVSTFPGLSIAVTVLSLGFLGDSIRDHLDPYLRTV